MYINGTHIIWRRNMNDDDYTQEELDNHANQCNPNNDEYNGN